MYVCITIRIHVLWCTCMYRYIHMYLLHVHVSTCRYIYIDYFKKVMTLQRNWKWRWWEELSLHLLCLRVLYVKSWNSLRILKEKVTSHTHTHIHTHSEFIKLQISQGHHYITDIYIYIYKFEHVYNLVLTSVPKLYIIYGLIWVSTFNRILNCF